MSRKAPGTQSQRQPIEEAVQSLASGRQFSETSTQSQEARSQKKKTSISDSHSVELSIPPNWTCNHLTMAPHSRRAPLAQSARSILCEPRVLPRNQHLLVSREFLELSLPGFKGRDRDSKIPTSATTCPNLPSASALFSYFMVGTMSAITAGASHPG